MFWRRIATFIGTIRTDFMVELERNPQAVRQGAAAAVCIAAAAAAMPVIAHRAAEQSEAAYQGARGMAFSAPLRTQSVSGAFEPAARVELVSLRSSDGLRARGTAFLVDEAVDRNALLVHAALRGPFAAPRAAEPMNGPEALDARELRCMSQAIYYEARSEPYRGQVAVGEVVMNRLRSRHFPNSICSVVYEGSHLKTGCQFTFTCDGSLNHRPRGRAWQRAQHVAAQVMLGYTRAVTARATHYHTPAVDPYWNARLVKTAEIGSHIFYRFPNRTESAVLEAALAQERAARQAVDANAAHRPAAEPVSLGAQPVVAPQDVARETRSLTPAPGAPLATVPPAERAAPPPDATPPSTEDGAESREVAA